MSSETRGRRVRIFLASPGDVEDEREQLARVVRDLNSTITAVAPEKGITLELIRWETHTHPDIIPGGDAQSAVFEQTGDYDIFIGILWKRFGTPTPRAGSGTEEEFRKAYDLKGAGKVRHIMFYFCQEKIAIPQNVEELDQLRKLIQFRSELTGQGLLGEYPDRTKFRDVVKADLDLALGRFFSEHEDVRRAVQRAGEVPRIADSVREEIAALAERYVYIRRTEPYTPERTRKFEEVFALLKSKAVLGASLVPELTKSVPPAGDQDPKAGRRLAAVAFLQANPDPGYFDWLGRLFGREQSFIEYHAAVALLNAARYFTPQYKAELRAAIEHALNNLEPGPSDRRWVLQQAQQVVNA